MNTKQMLAPHRLPFFIVLGLIMLVFVGFSTAWFVARATAIERLDTEAALWREKGNTVSWANRRIGGYPFRLTVQLDAVEIAQINTDPWRFRSDEATLHLQITQPSLMLFEFQGMQEFDSETTGPTRLQHDYAQGSVRFAGGVVEKASLEISAPVLVRAEDGRILAEAEGAEWHIQRGTEDPKAYRVYFGTDAPRLPGVNLGEPSRIQSDMVVTEAGNLLGDESLRDALAVWAAAGGQAQVSGWQIAWPDDAVLFLAGTMSVNPENAAWNGSMNVGARQPARVIGYLADAGMIDPNFRQLGALFFDGEDEVELPVTVRDGELRLMGQRVGTLPAAY